MAVEIREYDGVSVACKFCTSCCNWLPISMFSPSKRTRDKYKEWCKACNNAVSRRTRLKYKKTDKIYFKNSKTDIIVWDLNISEEEVKDDSTF